MADNSPHLLNDAQRLLFTTIPHELTQQELSQHYVLKEEDRRFIRRFHSDTNRLGVALQLCTLRHPGRSLQMMTAISQQLIEYVADQLSISPSAYEHYGHPRRKTPYDHLEAIRQAYGYRSYDNSDDAFLKTYLRPLALENDLPMPLMEAALTWMKTHLIIPPTLQRTEKVLWELLKETRATTFAELTAALTPEQRRRLLATLTPSEELGGLTQLAWLRKPAKQPSANSMYHLLARFDTIQALQLPTDPETVHPHRFRQLAQRGEQYRPQALSKLKNVHEQLALLFAHLSLFQQELIDQIVDMFDRWMLDLARRGRRRQRHHLYTNITTLNRDLNTLKKALAAFLGAKQDGVDPFEAVFAVVDEHLLSETLASVASTARPADMDYRDLVEHMYIRRRKAMLAMFRSLSFQSGSDSHSALEALNFALDLLDNHQLRVKQAVITIDSESYQAPLEHLKRKRWKRHALTEDGINPNYYELAAFDRLRVALRAGDITVGNSLRYLSFDDYLLPLEKWRQLKQTRTDILSVPDDVQTYLDLTHARFEEAATQLRTILDDKESHLSLTDGQLHVSNLKKSVPEESSALRNRLYGYMPQMQFAQMIIDVDQWTGFLSQFTQINASAPIDQERKALLIAALMENGMNIGQSRMAQATIFTEHELSTITQNRIREETIQNAMAVLDNFVLHHPYSRHWGQGTASSSDGMRIPVAVQSPHAAYNAKYFWYRRGITIVTHAADIWMPFYPQVIEDAREALYVIDALLHHNTDLELVEHYTDTAGATYHVFALCRLLGFRFMPRIRGVAQKYLYSVKQPSFISQESEVDDNESEESEVQDTDPLISLWNGTIDSDLLRAQWDSIRRLGASLRHGTAPAAVLMRKLAAYPKHSQLAQALREMGKLERSIFTLSYLPDVVMQRRILTGLNKGEALHRLARAIYMGQDGELQTGTLEGQVKRTSSLMLLAAIVSAWNTVYLDKIVQTLREAGQTIPEEHLKHISPIGWRHINFLGHYDIDLQQAYPLNRLRPLTASPPVSKPPNP